MLSLPRKRRETGFTLIELLTVIIIIGILAAIAVPVFSAQRGRANDAQVVSDVRNIVTSAETYLADRTKSAGDITGQSVLDYTSSANVKWDIKGNTTTGGYCIVAFHSSAKTYNSTSSLLSYDSTAGGLKSADGSCGKKDTNGNVVGGATKTGDASITTPTPTSSTAGGPAPVSAAAAPVTVASSPTSAWYSTGSSWANGLYIDPSDTSSIYLTTNLNGGGVYKVSTTDASSSTFSTGTSYTAPVKIGSYLYLVASNNVYRMSASNGGTATLVMSGTGDGIRKQTNIGNTMYVAHASGKISKFTINPTTGDAVGALTEVTTANTAAPGDIAYNPANDTLYVGSGSGPSLFKYVLGTGSASTVSVTNGPNFVQSMLPTADGNMIATSGVANTVYKINTTTGASTTYATMSGSGGSHTDIASDGSKVYVTSTAGIYRF